MNMKEWTAPGIAEIEIISTADGKDLGNHEYVTSGRYKEDHKSAGQFK